MAPWYARDFGKNVALKLAPIVFPAAFPLPIRSARRALRSPHRSRRISRSCPSPPSDDLTPEKKRTPDPGVHREGRGSPAGTRDNRSPGRSDPNGPERAGLSPLLGGGGRLRGAGFASAGRALLRPRAAGLRGGALAAFGFRAARGRPSLSLGLGLCHIYGFFMTDALRGRLGGLALPVQHVVLPR